MCQKKGRFPIYRMIPVQELRNTWSPLCWIGTVLLWITWTLQDLTGGFQEINPCASQLVLENQAWRLRRNLSSILVHWAGWCHRNNVSSWQLQRPNPTKAIFKKGSAEIRFHWSCSWIWGRGNTMRPFSLPWHFRAFTLNWKTNLSSSKFVFWIQSYCMSLVSANALVTRIAEAFTLTRIWNFVLFKTNYWQDERKT